VSSPTISLAAVALCLALLGSCRTGRDYPPVGAPRYGAPPPLPAVADVRLPLALRIVSFNIAFAREIDGAIALLTSNADLRSPDVLLLQEMDAEGTRRIASALGMGYVYYPAIFHKRTKRDFGNAILSRWPIVEDARLVLPHPSRYAGTHRIATAATLQVGSARVRVYSTHLGTPMDISGSSRRNQLRAIFTDAAAHPLVIVGGDLNSHDVGKASAEAGYAWPTREGPRTTWWGRWDHVFLKGLTVPDTGASGTIADGRGVSDHVPIWAIAIIR
jgi:endonuclease/exonuclease/phosphatase family metal-dependent hydrolase